MATLFTAGWHIYQLSVERFPVTMSEYDSPLRGMRSYSDTTFADDQLPEASSNGNISSFMSTPPPSRDFRGNWNNRTPFRGRGFHNRNQNAFRHSTPYNYNKRNSDNSPFNRGLRNPVTKNTPIYFIMIIVDIYINLFHVIRILIGVKTPTTKFQDTSILQCLKIHGLK